MQEIQKHHESEKQDLLPFLRGQTSPLFALLDAARDPRVLALLRDSSEEYQSLYEGTQGEELARWAPYLVRLQESSSLLENLVEEGWGRSWGVYLTCTKPLAEVRKHFRHFLMVKLEAGNEVYFRFYDPRVLRVYLPTCTEEEIKQFFGPVASFLFEDNAPDYLARFTPAGILGVKHDKLALSMPADSVPRAVK